MHGAILRHIESMGYATSVHQMGEYVEFHAVPIPTGEPVYVSRWTGIGPTSCTSRPVSWRGWSGWI
jgi:hypothetical protein